MTNEELKKKIKEILRKRMTELLGSCHTDEIPLTEEGAEAILFYADEFADALIAAGLTFEGEWKHRAEVAERALREFAVQISCRNCPFLKRCDTVPDAMDDYQGCFDMYLKQSEKELAEEGKDENY